MKNYKYILFDLDGTLTDPKVGITKAVRHALEYYNIKVDILDDLCKFIGPPLKDSFMEYYNFSDKDAEEAIFKYREYFGVTGLLENTVYNGIEDLLKTLKSYDKTLIVATSKPHVYAKKIMDHFDLAKYFDFISGSEFDGTRVKKADVIKYAIESCNINDLEHTVMVGDRKHDIIGAKEAGIDSIGVLYGYGNREELEDAGANYIVKDVNDLLNLLI